VWQALTTGGHGGFDCWLADRDTGAVTVETTLVQFTLPIASIGPHETVYEAGGLAYRVRVSRSPDTNPHTHLRLQRTVPLRTSGDNPLYVCVTQEDGNQAWSSPYFTTHCVYPPAVSNS
jgi:hypothetical protein